jgi:8-oxo-dGTP pyrophosphatase MutT (NUDIX family)
MSGSYPAAAWRKTRREDCVAREIAEELGVVARADELLDTWVYEVRPEQRVLIVTFGCSAERPDELSLSDEHDDLGLFPVSALDDLVMPTGYRTSIRRWHQARSATTWRRS